MSATPGGTPPVSAVALVGASFRTAGVGEREGIARRLHQGVLEEMTRQGSGACELATVETCNRLELYFAADSPGRLIREAVTRLGGEGPEGRFYVKQGTEAILHLFRVAAGLDSPVLGEEQILDQVRDAGRTARTSGTAK